VDIDIEIVDSLNKYVKSRFKLLAAIRALGSNRDPLTELSEVIVSQRLDADPAENRNQEGWDLKQRDGNTVEVKSVSNRSDAFKNGIRIKFPPMSTRKHHDQLAVVMIVDFLPQVILVFDENSAEQCYKGLNKATKKIEEHEKVELTGANLGHIWNKTLDLSQYSVNVIPLPWNTQT
jgi:hypothetical protein